MDRVEEARPLETKRHMLERWRCAQMNLEDVTATVHCLELRNREQQGRIAELERELAGCRSFQRSVDEALNTGDGVYRP